MILRAEDAIQGVENVPGARNSGFHTQFQINQVQKQEDQNLKVNPHYMVGSRLAWSTEMLSQRVISENGKN